MDKYELAEELLSVDTHEAEQFGFAVLEQGGFGAFPSPKKAMARALSWLSQHYAEIQTSICCNKKILKYVDNKKKDQELIEAISAALLDVGVFQGLPVTQIANLIAKKGVKEFCNRE